VALLSRTAIRPASSVQGAGSAPAKSRTDAVVHSVDWLPKRSRAGHNLQAKSPVVVQSKERPCRIPSISSRRYVQREIFLSALIYREPPQEDFECFRRQWFALSLLLKALAAFGVQERIPAASRQPWL
jgi:hypothetical protein